MYRIELTPRAEEELRALGRSGDKASINKVYRLFENCVFIHTKALASPNRWWATMPATGLVASTRKTV